MTRDRVERLLADLSARSRTETATIVATELSSGRLSEAERAIAIDIVTVLAQDAIEAVREAVAEHLKSSPYLPRHLALSLAHDVATVAVPVLRCTSVLHDEDLLAVIHAGNPAKQVAIARRETVPEVLTGALVATCDRNVIEATLSNHGARLAESAMRRVVDQFSHDRTIQGLLIDRPCLPIAVAQRLVECAADDLRARLMLRHRLPPAMFEELMMHGRDRVLSGMIASAPERNMHPLALSLAERGMLPPMLLLRCLCEGSPDFFEAGIAALAGVPPERAREVLHDQGPLGFQAIYRRAGLPELLFPAFRAAMAVRREYGSMAGEDVSRRILERMLDLYPGIRARGLEEALAQLWRVLMPKGADAHPATLP